ncbi:MAG: hypothetical protein HGA65_00035 [Oscillochloris sp.]|nr:hypothetical protein [Oscillochloris sp.]
MNRSGDLTNLLLGLAWYGELSSDHARRLWAPHDGTDFGVRAALTELHREGYASCRQWALPRPGGGPPLRQHAMWALTPRGREQLAHHELFPPRLFLPRARRTLPHDAMTGEILTRLIELARPAGLSGMYLEREVRIDPARSRPVMDAIVILRTGGGYDHDDLVPWTRDPLLPGEKRRRYAIENDRDSEALSVIAGKAHAYQGALTLDWRQRYGGFPIPLWVVPHERRLDAVMAAWRAHWPQGKWLITTDEALRRDRWLEHYNGSVRERTLFEASRDDDPTIS